MEAPSIALSCVVIILVWTKYQAKKSHTAIAYSCLHNLSRVLLISLLIKSLKATAHVAWRRQKRLICLNLTSNSYFCRAIGIVNRDWSVSRLALLRVLTIFVSKAVCKVMLIVLGEYFFSRENRKHHSSDFNPREVFANSLISDSF